MVAVSLRRWASLALATILLGATAVVVIRPNSAPAQTPPTFPVTLSGVPSCIQIGSTFTVSAATVDLPDRSHWPTPGAGVPNTTGWDDDVLIVLNNVVLATVRLTYFVPPGSRIGHWDMPPTTVTVPPGTLNASTIEVRHQLWWYIVFGSGSQYYVADTTTGSTSLGSTVKNTCNPTSSVKPACLELTGGVLTISGQANAALLSVMLDNASIVASRVPADASGFFSAGLKIPPQAAGTHRLDVGTGVVGRFVARGAPVFFTVPCSAPPPPTTTTSSTLPLPPPPSPTTTTSTTLPPAPALLDITPPTADAGALRVGQPSAPVVFTVVNAGASPTILGPAPVLGGPNPGDAAVTADSCANTALAPLSTCALTIVVTPADSGPRSMTITYTSTDPAIVAVTATLVAIGSYGAVITVEPSVVHEHGTVTVTGSGFPANAALEVRWQSVPGTVPVVTDATGAFSVTMMVPGHLSGAVLTLKVVDQLPRFTGPSADVLVQRPTARPAGSAGPSSRHPFWRS